MLKSTNARQDEAIKHHTTPLLVLAGAGSGKTKVIIEKITYLIEDLLYPSKSILAVTFTNKAAMEMKERIKGSLDRQKSKGILILTFHSLGLLILKKHYS